MELLAPAGSPEAVRAAVCGGADAIYLGYGEFNARRNARNFTETEVAEAVSYCHTQGVKVYLTLNTLLGDRELRMEYHKGILAYGPEEIHIAGGKMVVVVRGRELELRSMNPTELLITGYIAGLELT